MDLDSAADTAVAGDSTWTGVGGLGSSLLNLMGEADEVVLSVGVAGASARRGDFLD